MSQFNLETFIDRQKIGSRHLAVLSILTMIMFIDGFDIFMLGAIAPAIAEGFGEPSSNMTIIFLFQQVGLAVGAFTFSPLADRFGRKRMLIISAIAFGMLTLACTFAQSLLQLAVLRGISGVFLSAVLPMTIALISESTPRRRRGMFISIVLAGYVSGSAASGAVAAWLIDDFGWQSGFWIGGLVPLLCVPLMLLLLPESIQYLASRDKRSPRVAKMVRQIEPGIELRGDEEFNLGNLDPNAKKATLLDVFKEGRFLTTSIFWVACFLSMGNIALLAAWLPTFLQEMGGMPIQEFGVLIMIALSTGLLGTLTAGYLGDKFKPTRLVAVYYVGLGLSMVAIGMVPFGTVAFLIAILLWSFFQSGGQAGINAVIAQMYPPRMRSTGLGWAGGAGRMGGVVAPLMGGLALAHHMSLPMTMSLIAIPPLVVALLIFMLERVSARQTKALAPDPV